VIKLQRNASIKIENTVYLGDNGGQSCGTTIPQEKIVGYIGASATCCFKVTNTGETYLNTVVINDPILSYSDRNLSMLPPGTSEYLFVSRAITGPLKNIPTVTANPVSRRGDDYPGEPDVTASDPSEVDKVANNATILIDNRVYPNHDDGVSCHRAVEEVKGPWNSAVSFCVTVTNIGNTYLSNITVVDEELSFTDTGSIGTLAPGVSRTLVIPYFLTATRKNVAVVTATPVTNTGAPIPGAAIVMDSDPSSIVTTLSGTSRASVAIDNRVYLGEDYGAKCAVAVESVEGMINGTAVFCYTVKNTGATYLKNFMIEHGARAIKDNSIGILAPGQSELVVFPYKINGDLVNRAKVTANPVDDNGIDIPDLQDVQDTDPSYIVMSYVDSSSKSGAKDPYKPPNEPSECIQDNVPTEQLVCADQQVFLDVVTSDVQNCVKGMPVTVTVDASIHLNGGRYDLAWYIATDGVDSLNGTCQLRGRFTAQFSS
jgi:hypothetical protein